ncbi:hypothetical protein V5799_005172 [Amblyomma americanum]|uniref:Uncharacterized protein n=1 Tax=Amblyomma americanum TaxID=6943 RepID=A0AAQ4E008_AMBAM
MADVPARHSAAQRIRNLRNVAYLHGYTAVKGSENLACPQFHARGLCYSFKWSFLVSVHPQSPVECKKKHFAPSAPPPSICSVSGQSSDNGGE